MHHSSVALLRMFCFAFALAASPSQGVLMSAAAAAGERPEPRCALDWQTLVDLTRQLERAHDRRDVAASRIALDALIPAFEGLVATACEDVAPIAQRILALRDQYQGEKLCHTAPRPPWEHPGFARALADREDQQAFVEIHEAACVEELSAVSKANGMQQIEREKGQVNAANRFWNNWGSDACLLDLAGRQGTPLDPRLFYNVVQTPQPAAGAVASRFVQGQGPKDLNEADRYLSALGHHAAARDLRRLLVVNMAGGQIAHMGAATAQTAQAFGLQARYVDFASWPDRQFIGVSQAVELAQSLADWVEGSPEPALLAFNCNAGMDRSGLMNALTQTVLVHRAAVRDGIALLDAAQMSRERLLEVIKGIKLGRARAISTSLRYAFLRACVEDYLHQEILRQAAGVARS